LLVRKGCSVLVLERENELGGCIKTGEVTLPGFRHDLMSGFYPEFLAGAAYAELGEELAEHGLECPRSAPMAQI
jgi:phytoene dehydrogenase-like protein